MSLKYSEYEDRLDKFLRDKKEKEKITWRKIYNRWGWELYK